MITDDEFPEFIEEEEEFPELLLSEEEVCEIITEAALKANEALKGLAEASRLMAEWARQCADDYILRSQIIKP